MKYTNVARLPPHPHQPRLLFCASFFTILCQFGAFSAVLAGLAASGHKCGANVQNWVKIEKKNRLFFDQNGQKWPSNGLKWHKNAFMGTLDPFSVHFGGLPLWFLQVFGPFHGKKRVIWAENAKYDDFIRLIQIPTLETWIPAL